MKQTTESILSGPTLDEPDAANLLNFDKLWKEAIEAYKSSTGRDLLDDPLRSKLEACTSIDDVVSILDIRSKDFGTFRKNGHKFWAVMAYVSQMLGIVIGVGGEIAAAGSGPGGKAIFVAVGCLLQATRGVSGAYNTIEKVFGKVDDFFKRLETHLHSPIPITPQLRDIFERTLVEILKFIGLLTKYIDDSSEKTRASRVKKIIFHSKRRAVDLGSTLLDRNEARAILENIDDLTNGEHLRIATETHVTVHVISEGVRRMRNDVADIASILTAGQVAERRAASQVRVLVDNQIDDDILKWLNPPNPSSNHDHVEKMRHRNTCEWIFDAVFTKWERRSNGMYWIYGNPGTGKSVLSSSIIDRLLSTQELTAYFYFDFRDVSKQTIVGLLSSLTYQLALRSKPCYDKLKSLRAQNRSVLSPNEKLLTSCLLEMLDSCDRVVFIILDALDECPEPVRDRDILPFLKCLMGRNFHGLRLLVTSRPENDIRASFSTRSVTSLNICDGAGHADDIAWYIEQELARPAYCKWPQDTRDMAKKTLISKANGMFLWVNLQLQSLRSYQSIDVKGALDNLPSDLSGAYRRVFERLSLNPPAAERARRVLECVAFATRELTPPVLAEVLAIDFTTSDGATLRPVHRPKNSADSLLESCPGLLQIIDDDSWDVQRVQFAHFTVQEYLLSDSLPDDVRSFALTAESGHATLAQVCLATLTSSDPEPSLQRYALDNLGVHTSHCPENPSIERLLSQLFHPNSSHPALYNSLYHATVNSQLLYWAARHGLVRQIEVLLNSAGTDINAISGELGTALCAASWGDYLNVVELLVDRGADTEIGGKYGPSLHCARVESCQVISFLLDHGARINTHGGRDRTALHEAVGWGPNDAIIMLLERSASTDVTDELGQTPLHTACRLGRSPQARILLDYGAAVTSQDNLGCSPLHVACRLGDNWHGADTVAVLLEYGASVDSLEDYGNTPLHLAAANGAKDTLRLLLGHGAKVDVANNHGQSPFCLAIKNGHTHTARLLTEHGARPEVSLAAGWTFLHTVASSRNFIRWAYEIPDFKLDELLSFLEPGLDIDARTDGGQTALSMAFAAGNAYIIPHLIEHGANVNAADSNGFRPIDYAAARGRVDMIELLFHYGADSWTESGPYGTFMEIATRTHRANKLRFSEWKSQWSTLHYECHVAKWEGKRQDEGWFRFISQDLNSPIVKGWSTVTRGEQMMHRVRRYRSMGRLSKSQHLSIDIPTIDNLQKDSSRIAFAMRHLRASVSD